MSSSPVHLVITALGSDRAGIVNTITRHVSQCGCNIEDSRLALLGGEFTFVMLLSGSANAINMIESTLPIKGAELELLIVMKRTPTGCTPVRHEGFSLSVEVPDSPRIIERFTALLTHHQMHIAELMTRAHPGTPAMLSIRIHAYGSSSRAVVDLEKNFQQLCYELSAKGVLHTDGRQETERL
ncbi:ACT domain-containing protein [Rosenbergiella australiborealis]|uniref:ACT domain-containing protein n=1 Tax=Rosenbergiella australiborealis TaxID=1544696 RepID=UPI001BDADB3E|nr:ACT domain-containing protein [Rosenbergiella australiborealis]